MRGFQTQTKRKAHANGYADGGMVQSIKRAFGMDEERNARIAAYRERAAQEKAAAAAAAQPTAPGSAPSDKAISDYSGMGATQRREKAAGLKDGGMVRGPGTGISDDVPDRVPEGTYIMPADSTAQLGPDKLASMGARGFKAGGKKAAGGKSVPVNLSNGEFKMPPEQVHAVGVQALEQMKNATHTPAAQQAGEPEMFFANGGPVFGSRGLEGLKAMIPKVAAMGFPQKQAAPVAPAAPAQGSRNVADLKAMIPQMEAMGYKQNPQHLADGGQVRREEGGGLSKDAVMAAIAKQAAQQQPAAQPAQQPAARGFARPATDFLRNPGGILAQRERQAGGYADGGMVDEEQQRLANQTAMYVRGAQEAAATAPAPTAASVPGPTAPAVKDPLDGGAAFGFYPQLAGGKRTSYAMDEKLRTGVQATGPSTFAPATPTDKTIIGGGNGQRMNATQDPRSLIAATAAPAPAAVAPATPSAAGGGRGMVNPSAEPPSAVTPNAGPQVANTPTAPSAAAPTPGNVTRVGNTYSGTNVSGDLTVNGQAPRGGFMVADGPRGFSPGAPATAAPQGVAAPTVLNSSNSWQARNDLRNLEVSAKSITNRPEWSGTGMGRFRGGQGGGSPDVAAYQAALANDLALKAGQPAADVAAMRENAGIQREGMQQDGATTRTGMTEQGANTREAGRNALATGELGLRREAQGFQTRAAQQQEQLRNVILDPKATPAQKRQAQESLRALGGKAEDNRFTVVPGGQEWDATAGAMRNVPARVLNNQTGQFVDQAKTSNANPYAEGQRLRGKDGKDYIVKNGAPVPI